MKSFAFFLISFVLVSCLKSKPFYYSNGRIVNIQISKDLKKMKVQKMRSDDGYIEWVYSNKLNERVFITNDLKNGSSINLKNRIEKYGSNIEIQFVVSDTLSLNGLNGLNYWKEVKQKNFVKGYCNVRNKKDFDVILENIK